MTFTPLGLVWGGGLLSLVGFLVVVVCITREVKADTRLIIAIVLCLVGGAASAALGLLLIAAASAAEQQPTVDVMVA